MTDYYNELKLKSTECPRNLVHIYIMNCYIKTDKISKTYRTRDIIIQGNLS